MADRIDRLRIATPCPTTWEAMEGDERVRYCAVCSLNVYNIAELTREEAHALIAGTEGRLCVRLYRRADGTVLTRDCPTGLRALRRRASRAGAAIVAAFLSLPAFAFGWSKGVKVRGSKVEFTTEQAAAPQPAALTGVTLADGTPVPHVTVILRDEATGRQVTVVTDANGAFTFPSLAEGKYRADLLLPGLKPTSIQHLELKSSVVTHARVEMRVDVATVSITVGGAVAEPWENSTISATFTQSFIDKLPH